jgi:hypothetical protein
MSKSETNPNFQMTKCPKQVSFGHWDLENLNIVSKFEFRASDLDGSIPYWLYNIGFEFGI